MLCLLYIIISTVVSSKQQSIRFALAANGGCACLLQRMQHGPTEASKNIDGDERKTGMGRLRAVDFLNGRFSIASSVAGARAQIEERWNVSTNGLYKHPHTRTCVHQSTLLV